MPSPFGLQESRNILAAGTNVQIFISTPKEATGELLFQNRVDAIVDMLTEGDGPYQGAQVTTRGYVKPPPGVTEDPVEASSLDRSIRGKVLIEYDNDFCWDDQH